MEPEAPIGGKRRGLRRWRSVLVVLLAMAAGALLLGNLFLSSAWTCRWIASKIESRIGLETRVGGVSWTPWNGAAIRGIEILQPAPLRAAVKEPLMRIDVVRATPEWRAWLRGRIEVRSLELDSPRLVLPLELISHLAKSATPPAPAGPAPTVTPVAPPPPAVAGVQAPTTPPTTPPPEEPAPPPPPAGPPRPTGWVRVRNASFAMVHAGSQRTLLEISNASGAIPVSGDPAPSTLKIASVSSFGAEAAANLTLPLEWRNPTLSLRPHEIQIGSYKALVAAKIARFSGFPVQFEAQLPRQPLPEIALPFNAKAAADFIAVNARFRGLLLAPATWQGDFVAEAVSPSLKVAEAGTKFDRGSAITVLRGGILSCADARLIGDDLSLLGNATLLADGRLAGAGRLVAPPDIASSIAGKIFPKIADSPSLTPLSTPQRAAFDVEAAGSLGQLLLRLGKDGPIVKLEP